VQHQQHETCAAAALCVFQHFLIATGVPERGDGTAADVLIDANGLVGLIIIEVQFRQPHENRSALTHFKLRLDAATDDPFRRNVVHALRPRGA
jgi:hypothetical protein